MPTSHKTKSHFKGGLLAGAIFGIAAGIFMSSKQGKQLAKQLRSQTTDIQKRLMKELNKTRHVSEETYSDAIDRVLSYYTKSRKIASKEVPELRRYLLAKWREIQRELKK